MADRYNSTSLLENGAAVNGAVNVLLVEPDETFADVLHQHLVAHVAGMNATCCGSLASARAYLSGNAYDAVVMAEDLPDGTGLELLDLRSALGLTSHFFIRTSKNGEVSEAALAAGATACIDVNEKVDSLISFTSEMKRAMGLADRQTESVIASDVTADAATAMLEELRAEAGATAHAVSNPLTVITGNAQFLSEVAKSGQIDPLMMGPIEDINAATQQLTEALERLAVLRERIADTLGTSDRLQEG